MKALLLILMSLVLVNCGSKKFTASQSSSSPDDPSVVVDNNDDDDDDNDDDDTTDDDTNCPRYDLVVTSTDSSNQKLNFTYTFNAEMTHTSLQGKHKIQFSKAKYVPCSKANYTNTNVLASLIPLKKTEDLTAEVMITHGGSCVSTSRLTTIQVFDSATNKALFDEDDLRQSSGCEFGYTDDGKAIRAQLINLADGIANATSSACN